MQKVHALTVCVLLFGTGCNKQPSNEAAPGGSATLKIERLEPNGTSEKTPFNVQPTGEAAMSVAGADLPAGSTVLWNGDPLQTVGSGPWVAAVVPAKLFEAPGTAKITVRSADGATTSNALDFTVYAKTGPAPSVTQLYPDRTAPGKGFNVQPGGESALGIAGGDFIPGVNVFFDGKQVKTVFGTGTGLSAAVPAAALGRAGAHQVWVVNPDGKNSNKLEFTIAKE